MSIPAMQRVFQHSNQRSSTRTFLLSVADVARDEDGVAWPTKAKLAEMCNVSERHVARLRVAAEEAGEMYAEQGTGRGHPTRYFVTCGLSETEVQDVLMRRFEMGEDEAKREAKQVITRRQKDDTDSTLSAGQKDDIPQERVTSASKKGDITVEERVTWDAPFNRPPLPPNEYIFLTPHPLLDLSQRVNPEETQRGLKVANAPPLWPSLSEEEVVQHLTRLSTFEHQCSRATMQKLRKLGTLCKPARKEPGKFLRQWTTTFDRLQRLDGYSREDIEHTMSWLLREDSWWIKTANFRSANKLRKKHDDGETYFDLYFMKAKVKTLHGDEQRARNNPVDNYQRILRAAQSTRAV